MKGGRRAAFSFLIKVLWTWLAICIKKMAVGQMIRSHVTSTVMVQLTFPLKPEGRVMPITNSLSLS